MVRGIRLGSPPRPPQTYHMQERYAQHKRKSRWCKRPPLRFVLIWAAFVFVLTVLYRVSHDTIRQPLSGYKIGWQAHDKISVRPDQKSTSQTQNGEASNGATAQEAWDSEALDASLDPSFPLDAYAPLLPNPAPITDITVESCSLLSLGPCLPRSSQLKEANLGRWVRVDRPLGADTAAQKGRGALGGGVFDKLFGNIESRYIFYRRSRRAGVRKVVDVKIVKANQPAPGTREQGWHKTKKDLGTPFFRMLGTGEQVHLWFQTVGGHKGDDEEDDSPMASPGQHHNRPGHTIDDMFKEIDDEFKHMIAGDGKGKTEVIEIIGREKSKELGKVAREKLPRQSTQQDAITEIDLVYGQNEAFPGFTIVGQISPAKPSMSMVSVSLAVRRRPQPDPSSPIAPTFHQDGKFKIMQIADLHFSTSPEPCRGTDTTPCNAKTMTDLMGQWLDEEKPDLVVFSGDQLNGQGTSWDERSVLATYLRPVIDRKILWTSIMGNHDSQTGLLTRRELQLLLSHMPYSLARAGPANLHNGTGAGNYYIHLRAPTPDATHLFSLYFLDSGVNAPVTGMGSLLPWSFFGISASKGYDWVRKDQIQWLLDQSRKVVKHIVPYKPDSGKDLGRIWAKRRQDQDSSRLVTTRRSDIRRDDKTWDAHSAEGSGGRKPPALLWVHIPLPEFFSPVDKNELGQDMIIGQPQGETSGIRGAQKEGGLYDALQGQGAENDVVGVLSGHMHENADCRRIKGIWMCFNGGSSLLGYGSTKMERRVRIIELEQWGEQINTWHRYERTRGRLDEATLWEMFPAKGKH
ncbi:Metallo-dependent phosphatase [Ceraceosorus guamensis]|uniref:Metallo-dependent phosphatase n=1 Tax=Ceraceosorus guamensis TaxID=1522189 RepID=A0A316VVZ2_9BASI|nr:Metallo-dependent phosphatase [Ceraceosorus guamensis]PWN41817.1 Metallo-dependent phosphatase [Ceraceosorus guamensis]